MSDYYLAPCLVKQRSRTNAKWPHRDHASDGWIGDASHQARKSDHNPDWDANGVVRATDTDQTGIHVPSFVAGNILHSTIEYAICDRLIMSRVRDFRPIYYDGDNGHYEHVHTSCRHGKKYENKVDEELCFVSWTPSWATPEGKGTKDVQRARQLQALLIAHRYTVVLDGDFGADTEAKLRQFQTARGLKVDGIAGAATLKKMLTV